MTAIVLCLNCGFKIEIEPPCFIQLYDKCKKEIEDGRNI